MRKLLIFFCWFGCAVTLNTQGKAADNSQGLQWNPSPGVKISNASQAGLYRVWGQTDSWSYAQSALRNFSPTKGDKYRLEALVRVNRVSSNAMPPFLKIGSYRNSQFVKNYFSQKYDLSSRGRWQKLWREFEVGQSDLTYRLAISKATTNSVDVDMEIKDIKFSKIRSFSKLSKFLVSGQGDSSDIDACQHPCLHLNDTKLASLQKQIGRRPNKKFWEFVEKKANAYRLQSPPQNLHNYSEAGIRQFGDRLPYLAMAFLVTRDQRYLEGSRKWFSAILSYENWASNKDIGSAHLLYGLSITYDWLYNELDTAEKKAIVKKVEQQASILGRSLASANIGWSTNYLNNHNYVNAMALGIAGMAFQQEISDAKIWVQLAEHNFIQVLNALSPDGASHEGVGYWSYGLDALLKYYDAVAGETMRERFHNSGYFRNASTYRLYMSLPGYTQNVDYADSPRADYFGPGYLLRKLSVMFDDGRAQWLAGAIEQARTVKQFSWLDLLWFDSSIQQQEPLDLSLSHHFNNIGIVVIRSSWKADASWLFYKAGDPQGEYAKSQGLYEGGHIHPDAGNVLWWANGNWVLQDDGYTAIKATKYHNVMTFNGQGQLGEGKQWFKREDFVEDSSTAAISRVNITGDFKAVESYVGKIYPKSAGVQQWKRTLFSSNNYLIVHDEMKLKSSEDVRGYFHLPDGLLSKSDSGYVFKSNDQEEVCIYSLTSENINSTYRYEKKQDHDIPENYNRKYRDNHRLVFSSNMRGKNFSHTTVFDSSPDKKCRKSISANGSTVQISDNGSKLMSCSLGSLKCNLGSSPRPVPKLEIN